MSVQCSNRRGRHVRGSAGGNVPPAARLDLQLLRMLLSLTCMGPEVIKANICRRGRMMPHSKRKARKGGFENPLPCQQPRPGSGPPPALLLHTDARFVSSLPNDMLVLAPERLHIRPLIAPAPSAAFLRRPTDAVGRRRRDSAVCSAAHPAPASPPTGRPCLGVEGERREEQVHESYFF